jgi:hypothetical protein
MQVTCSMHKKPRNECRILVGHLKVKEYLKDIGIDRRIVLKWIVKLGTRACNGFVCMKV